MDHLPFPSNANVPPLEIPFICEDILTYDQNQIGHFNDIPTLADFSQDSTAAVKYWQECNPQRVAGEAQARIYFGLLIGVLGCRFVLDDFICISNVSNEPIITLAKLQDRLQSVRQTLPIKALKVLAATATSQARMIRGKSPLAEKVALSIDILAWSMEVIRDPQCAPESRIGGYVKDGILEKRMLAAGWCRYWTKVFHATYPAALTYYLASVSVDFHSGHKTCSELDCKGNNVNMERGRYISQHTTLDCRCAFKGPNSKYIEQIIQGGGVPLIKLSKTTQGDVNVSVVELGYGKPFIAISHVWSGGLGNPKENTVPSCQLKFIYNAARRCQNKEYGKGMFQRSHDANTNWTKSKLYQVLNWLLGDSQISNLDQGPLEWYLRLVDSLALSGANEDSNDLYIWFDTLCIPVARDTGKVKAPDEEKAEHELKMKAINKMAFVYASAMHVLVIDHTARDILYRQAGDLELAAILLTSPWMSRCWTFQEASLARQFSFILADEIINPRKWFSDIPADRCSSMFERILKYQCLTYVNSMPDIMNQSIERKEQQRSPLVAVWNALSSRNTSQREDLHGLLGIMLNLSAFEILQMDKGQRMLGILRAQEKVPLSMIFLPYPDDAPLIKGCEWLPSYPSRAISEQFGYMTWNTESEGLDFVPSDTASVLFLIELNDGLDKNEFLVTVTHSDSVVIQVKLLLPEKRDLSNYKSATLSIFLHGYHGLTPANNSQGVGACFVLNSGEALKRQQLRLTFICPLEYIFWNGSSKSGPAIDESELELSFSAKQAESGAKCFLNCGQS